MYMVITIIVLVFLLLVGLFQILWNTTMPEVFNLKKITLGQAFKMMLMGWVLFGGGVGTTQNVSSRESTVVQHPSPQIVAPQPGPQAEGGPTPVQE